MNKLILATNNPGKIAELQELLHPIECIPQSILHISEAEETGLTFVENAILKARNASLRSNEPALADDSGLVVEALNGQPGIHSARFAGKDASNTDRINLLLQRLKGVPNEQRQAYFYCVIVLLKHADDPTPLIATGTCSGYISTEPKGELGFGYDPVFYLPTHQCTMAELSSETKNTLSHRAMALKRLLLQIPGS